MFQYNTVMEKALSGMFRQTEKHVRFVIWFWLMVSWCIFSEWCWLKKETVLEKLYIPTQPVVYLTLKRWQSHTWHGAQNILFSFGQSEVRCSSCSWVSVRNCIDRGRKLFPHHTISPILRWIIRQNQLVTAEIHHCTGLFCQQRISVFCSWIYLHVLF